MCNGSAAQGATEPLRVFAPAEDRSVRLKVGAIPVHWPFSGCSAKGLFVEWDLCGVDAAVDPELARLLLS